jgi:hypothetical protein
LSAISLFFALTDDTLCLLAAGGYPAADSPTVSSFPQLSTVLAAMHSHAGKEQQQHQQQQQQQGYGND